MKAIIKAIEKVKIHKVLMGTVMIMAMLFTFNNIDVMAANCNVGVSSVNGAAGETVVVNVTVTTDQAAAGQIGVSYDTNFLEYSGSDSSDVSGGQAGIVLIVSADIPTSGYSVPLKFKLKQPGSTVVSVANNTSLFVQMDTSDESMNYNASNGTINVEAATTASNDSKLSGLSVQAVTSNGESSNVVYTPSFSPDVTEYRADLGSNVTKLVIATTLSDSKSQTAVSGTRIDPGNNKTTVTVTAEDGSVTKYTLYTTRAVEETTEPSTSEEESTSAQDFDRTPKKIEALNKYIIQDFTLTTIPEGFEEGTITYEGSTVAALRGISKPLALICLADDAQGTNINKYIYNEVSGGITLMVDITSMQKMYTILPTGDDYQGPAGYTQTELDVNGNMVKAWVKSAESDFYVVYAMNWNGEISLYSYDKKEQTMQRFVEGNKTENVTDMPKEENKEYILMKKQYDEMYDEYVNDHQKKNKQIVTLLVVLAIIMVVALVIIFILYKKSVGIENKQHDGLKESEDEEEIGSNVVETSNNKQPVKSKKIRKDIQVLDEEETDEIGFEAAIEESKVKEEIVEENKSLQKDNIIDNKVEENVNKKNENNKNPNKEKTNNENKIKETEVKENQVNENKLQTSQVEKKEERVSSIGNNKERVSSIGNNEERVSLLGSREEVKASATDIIEALDTQSLKEVIEETNKLTEDEDDSLEIEFFDLND